MRIALILLMAMLTAAGLQAQEICNNGVDDNGNGLIDLQDPACTCQGIISIGDITDNLPNPSFEFQNCCPSQFSDINCAQDWFNGNNATTDYMHECGFILSGVQSAGLVPFPSGGGIVGAVYSDGWKEYISACMNVGFEAGQEYTLSFYTAFVSINNDGSPCGNGPSGFAPVAITLYGNPSCNNLTIGGTQCPAGNNGWVVLGAVTHQPASSWEQVSINFIAPANMSAIMIGPPCNLPPGYGGSPCFAYALYDGLTLEGGTEIFDLDITLLGQPCDLDFSFLGEVQHDGSGTWQWFFNGVALNGQNDPFFSVASNQYQSGTYQATYTTPDGCVMDSISVIIPPRDTTPVEVFFCPGSSISCAGETFFSPGYYEVTLTTLQGCDSVVACTVTEYPLPPITYLEYDTCGPVGIPVCGDVVSNTGYYEFTCFDFRGCDSVVVLDLRVMTPEAVIQPPGMLTCDIPEIVLNGLASPINLLPTGSTTYEWTGPFGGFNSALDQPTAIVIKPGQYCLIMTFENNGISCTDTACVTVLSDQVLPNPPLITGGGDGCVGDTLFFQRSYQGAVVINGWEWVVPPDHDYQVVDDSSLMAILRTPGTFQMCTRVLSECGPSNLSCLPVNVFPVDQTLLQGSTCDPLQAGTFTQHLLNQFGCDSTVITEVTLSPSDFFFFDLTTCDPQQASRDTLFLVNQFGCDSIRITHVSLLPSNTIDLTFFTCDPQQAGRDTLFLTNQFGCDSIVRIETIFTGNYQESQTSLLCGSGVNYADTLLVTSGPCDSLFITNFVYVPLDTTWLQATTCNPAQVGQFSDVLPSHIGCDSTIITVVSLLPSHDILVEGITCVASEARFEVLNLTNQFGCDSIVTIDIRYMGVDTQFVQATTCNPAQAGTVTQVLPGMFCDTVRVTTTQLLPSSQSLQAIVLCQASGPASDTLVLANYLGCDSLAIRTYEYVDLRVDVDVLDVRCTGFSDGVIQVEYLDGGLPPIQFRLNQGTWQNEPRFDNLPPGNYTVYVRESGGCTDTLGGLIVGEGLTLVLDAGPDQWVDAGDFIRLELFTSLPLAQIQWSATDFLSCPTCPATTLGPVRDNQTVLLTASTADGCNASDALEVRLRPQPEVYIPNSFSPNFDGINDIFSVYGNELVVSVRNLAIYDRWGNALYSRTDLPVNDPSAGWDGQFRDKAMDPGVYIYVVIVELQDGSTRLFKGDVTLVK